MASFFRQATTAAIASDGARALLCWVASAGMAYPAAAAQAADASSHAGFSSKAMGIAIAAVSNSPQTGAMSFDIPELPLDAALEAYGAATGLSVIYNSRLTEGRRSQALNGSYDAKEALRRLIGGSGLAARYTSQNAVVLVEAPAALSAEPNATAAQRYRGLVQAGVREAFCAEAELAAGDRRMAFRFWVGRSGVVERAELLDTTGDPRFDAKVVDRLMSVSVGEALPEGMLQPFTMLVMPRSSGRAWGCPAPASAGAAP